MFDLPNVADHNTEGATAIVIDAAKTKDDWGVRKHECSVN